MLPPPVCALSQYLSCLPSQFAYAKSTQNITKIILDFRSGNIFQASKLKWKTGKIYWHKLYLLGQIVRHKEHKQAEGTQAGTAPPGRLPSPYLSSAGVYQVPGNAPTRCPVTGQRCPVNSGPPAKTDRATTPRPGNTTGQRPKTGVETGQPLPVARSLDSQYTRIN